MTYYKGFIVNTTVVEYNNTPMLAFQAKESESLVHLTDGKTAIHNVSTVGLKVLGDAKLHIEDGKNFLLTKRGVINANNGILVKSTAYQNFIVSAYKAANKLPSTTQPVIEEPVERTAELINREIAMLEDTLSQVTIAVSMLKLELMELAEQSCETPELETPKDTEEPVRATMTYKGTTYMLTSEGELMSTRSGKVTKEKDILAAWASI